MSTAASLSPLAPNPWERVLARLEKKLEASAYAAWLKPTTFGSAEGSTLVVRVPNTTFKDWIHANYTLLIQDTLRELALPFDSVEFLAESTGIPPQRSSSLGQVSTEPAGAPAVAQMALFSPLNAKYTFASFVVGSSNQFAHAAASRVARDPARSYNPLFLYGGVGLGKTHLMHAIGHLLRQAYPQWRVVYISAERFLNEMVQCMLQKNMGAFHQRFREVDTLLVDDIQFLSGKEGTQEEFFHTFNALYERQAQIVVSSDRPPKEISQIEERLRSRFEWGLIADIQPPDLETRQAILMKKAEIENFALPEKIALFIATSVRSNIRELEGCLVRLIAYASLTGEPITEAMAHRVLRDLVENRSKRPTIELIQKTVCEHFNLRLTELKARDNSKRVVVPRQIAMWLCREMTDASLPEVARAFGDKHHTTVLHSISKISKLKLVDKDLHRTLNKILSIFE